MNKKIKELRGKLLKAIAREQKALREMIEVMTSVNVQPQKWNRVQAQIDRYLDRFHMPVIELTAALECAQIEHERKQRAYHDIAMARTHTYKPFEGLWAVKAVQ